MGIYSYYMDMTLSNADQARISFDSITDSIKKAKWVCYDPNKENVEEKEICDSCQEFETFPGLGVNEYLQIDLPAYTCYISYDEAVKFRTEYLRFKESNANLPKSFETIMCRDDQLAFKMATQKYKGGIVNSSISEAKANKYMEEAFRAGWTTLDLEALNAALVTKPWEKFWIIFDETASDSQSSAASIRLDREVEFDLSKDHLAVLYVVNFACPEIVGKEIAIDLLAGHERIHALIYEHSWQYLKNEIKNGRANTPPKNHDEYDNYRARYIINRILEDPRFQDSLLLTSEYVKKILPDSLKNNADAIASGYRNFIFNNMKKPQILEGFLPYEKMLVEEIAVASTFFKLNDHSKSIIIGLANSIIQRGRHRTDDMFFPSWAAYARALYSIVGEQEKAESIDNEFKAYINKLAVSDPNQTLQFILNYLMWTKMFDAAIDYIKIT